MAFQEQDDLLGVWGAASDTGKPDAADVLERKRGLPAAMALSEPDAPTWLREAYDDPSAEMAPELVERIIEHFDTLDLKARIEQRVGARYRRALDCLEAAEPKQPAGSYLAAICESLVARRA